MPATMQIVGWKAEGLRCPDHQIDCSNSDGTPFPITLIQMPNGTGKTTTLRLLRAALSGAAKEGAWDSPRIMEFQKRDNPEESGLFELRLLLNGKRVTITMEFDFENGRVDYKTTRGHGQKKGFDPPREFQRFMNEDFVKFYVFDGELADNLLSREHTDAEKAVESLFQIHLLGYMKDKVSAYWDDQTQNLTARAKTGYRRRKNMLDKWRSRLEELERQKRVYKRKLESISWKLRRQQDRYDSEIKREKSRAESILVAQTEVAKLGKDVRKNAQDVLDAMRDPHAVSTVFATSIYNLKDGLDRVKLPASAAREWFEELAEEQLCVCGRPIDTTIKHTIKERAHQYLGTDDVALLNNIKGVINDAVGESLCDASDTLSANIESLTELVGEEWRAKNELDGLKRDAERSDPEVMHAKTEIDRLNDKMDKLSEELARFGGKDESVRLDRLNNVDVDRIFSIETIREGVSILEDQVAEVANTLTLRRKRDVLTRILKIAHAKAHEHINSAIRDDANRRIAELMPDNMIRIDVIHRCIVLKGQSSGSAGENLSIGYAFLATLFNRPGEHQLPFVVDSPANPIDYDIRPKIGRLAPSLTDQFIAFVISSEREKFLPSLQSSSNNKRIEYITLFRKGASRHEEKALKSPGYKTTKDGIQVLGRGFFSDFQEE